MSFDNFRSARSCRVTWRQSNKLGVSFAEDAAAVGVGVKRARQPSQGMPGLHSGSWGINRALR